MRFSVLLSQLLVAFTIEADDEFEHRMPHRTATGPARGGRGPWLISLAMWANFLRYLDEKGKPERDLKHLTDMTNLAGMKRWGYVTVQDGIIAPTVNGLRAQAVWRPLTDEVEQRWRTRFGEARVDELRRLLLSMIDCPLPQYLPVVSFSNGMRTTVPAKIEPGAADLSVLLSQVLLMFTLDYESESAISLPLRANVLRVLDATGVRVLDLPVRSGVSKEAISAALTFLTKHDLVAVDPDPAAARGKVVRLTPRGLRSQAEHTARLDEVESVWRKRFPGYDDLHAVAQAFTDGPLLDGLRRHPEGWRAQLKPPTTLPYQPMVLHRGGYPDGS